MPTTFFAYSTSSGQRCDQWNVYTLTRTSGSRIPSNAVIVNAGYDIYTYSNFHDSNAEFGIYGFAIRGGPYTVANYDSSAPTTLRDRCSMNIDGTSSSDDYYWDFQGGETWIRGRTGPKTRCDCYNCGFEANQLLPGSGVISTDSINVKVKFGNSRGDATYIQNDEYGNSAITVWIQWEYFSINTDSVRLSVSQSGFTINMVRSGSASISHGRIDGYQFFGANDYRSGVTSGNASQTLSMNQLGTEYSFSIVVYYSYGVSSGMIGTTYANVQFTPSRPTLSWSAGAHIEFSQSGVQAKIDRDGSAVFDNGFSGTCYYRVFCENTRKNSDGDTGDSWIFDPTAYGTEVTFKLDAYATIDGYTFYSSTLTVKGIVNNHSTVKYHNGQQWVECIVYYYDGTQWVECIPYYYDGTRWVELSHS